MSLSLTPVFSYARTRARLSVRVRAGARVYDDAPASFAVSTTANTVKASKTSNRSSHSLSLASSLVLAIAMFVTIGLNLVHPAQTSAATSSTINFQARLTTNTGAIVPDGNYNIEFKLYNVSSAGTAQWTEDYLNSASQGVTVINGYFSLPLGSITAFPTTINWDQPEWLTMNVGGTTTGAPTYDGEMTPRLAITAVPYAFRAGQLALTTGSNVSTLGWNTQTTPNSILLPNEAGTVCTNNATGACTLTGGFVRLQATTPGTQQTGNLNISGTGILGGNLTLSGATPVIGVSTANTGISLQANGTGTLTLNTTGAGIVNVGTANTTTVNLGNAGSVTSIAGSTINLNSATLQRTAAGTTTLNLNDSANTTLALTNSGTGVANLTVEGSGSFTGTGTGLSVTNNATIGGTLNISGWNSVIISTPTNTVVNDNTTSLAQSPISGSLWHDLLAFDKYATPTFEQYNGTAWNSAALNNNLFANKQSSNITVADGTTTTGARWTWNGVNFANSSGKWLNIGFNYTNPVPIMTILFETSTDGVTWTTHHTSSGNTQSAIPAWFYVTSYGADTYLRLTITSSNSNPINLNTIRLLTDRWGNQGGGSDYAYPYTWDGSQNITTGASLTANGTVNIQNSGNLAIAGTTVLTSARVLQNVTADTGILTSGILGVARGGTGAGSFTTNGVLYGNGTGVLNVTAASTAANQCLITTGIGTAPVWGSCTAGGGVTTVGPISATSNANGATITGNTINLTVADGTNGGVVSNTTQTFAGAKTFAATPTVGNGTTGTINLGDSSFSKTSGSDFNFNSGVNGTTGLYTGATNGTQRIDASGNLVNIGTITSGLINGQTINTSANFTGTLTVASTITGTTLNGTVGINTGAGAGTQRIDASGNLLNIGTITATGKITTTGDLTTGNQNTRSLTRTLPTVANDEVDVGSFVFSNGGGALDISVVVPSTSYSQSKKYIIPVEWNGTSGTWQIVQPISDVGAYGGNDFTLEINITNGTTALRIRRVSGTTAGTAYVTIVQQGVSSDAFTPSTAISSVTAPTVFYSPTSLTQVGGSVGIGTMAPGAYKLNVQGGDVNLSGNLAIGGTTVLTSARVLQNVTADTSILTSGTLGVARGGTGAGTLTGLVIGNGTSPMTATTTSAGVAGVISDETGSGSLVFGTSPSITTSLTTGSATFSLLNTTATTINAFGAATTLSVGAANSNTTFNGAITAKGYGTAGTSNLYAGQWTLLGRCTITGQYDGCSSAIQISSGKQNGSTTGNEHAQVYWRVKQQNALAAVPYINLDISDMKGIGVGDIVSVTTVNDASSTVVELYGRINLSYQSWQFNPTIVENSNAGFVFLANQGFSTTLPAGTQTAAAYGTFSTASAAAPSVTFENNTATGLYSVGTNALGITTGGTLRVQVDNTNVNIVTDNLQTAGVTRLTNAGVLQNVTADTSILTSGILSVARGGTGAGSFTTNGVLYGNGTGVLNVTAASTAANQCLITTGVGTAPVWGSCTAGGGVTTVGPISATSNANGATITGNTINLTVADGTNGGVVSNTTQTFAGAKTFAATPTVGNGTTGTINLGDSSFSKTSGSGFLFNSNVNGTTGINTGAGAGTNRIDASGNLVNIGNITGSGAVTLSSTGGTNALTLNSGSGTIALGATVLSRTATGTTTINLNDTANTTLAITNSGTGVANLTVDGGGTFSGLLAANGGLTVQTGGTLTVNGDAFTDLTGAGLVVTTGALSVGAGSCITVGATTVGVTDACVNAASLGGITAANYTRSDLTMLGKTGSVSFDSATNTAAAWAGLPVGYSRMFASTIGTAGGAPVNNYGYFTKIASRDTGSGWGGLWAGYSNGQNYIGRAATSADLATWDLLWSNNNDGTGSGLDADLLDGQHGSYYQNASNINAGTLAVANGGTGVGTLTTNGVLYGNGTGAIGATLAGTTGQCLTANTGSAPTWGSCAGSITLQTAYNAYSTAPAAIVVDSTRQGVLIRDNATTINNTLFAVQNNAGTSSYFGVASTGLITMQPATSLLSGQTHIAQTLTNASSTGGVVQGFSQVLTVAPTVSASTTNGINLALTDSTALTNTTNGINLAVTDNGASGAKINTGLKVVLSGTNTSQIQYGVNVAVATGFGITSTSTGATTGTGTCVGATSLVSYGVCGASTANDNLVAGVYGIVSNSQVSGAVALGAGMAGVMGTTSDNSISSGYQHGLVGGAYSTSTSGAYSSIGVLGTGSAAGTGSIYAGYFSVSRNNTATAGAALYASTAAYLGASTGNGRNAVYVLQAAGGAGQATSDTTGVIGGAGAAISLTTGSGGSATGASGSNIGGAGGLIAFQGGNGGAATSGIGGAGADISLIAGNGGNGSTTGGRGGNITLSAGSVGTGGVPATGSVIVKNASNTTGAFQIQNVSGISLLTANTSNMRLTVNGDMVANGAATATTGTTEATARANVTTVTLTAAGSFANNDVIFINNAGQDYYTRIVSGGGTTTLTVSPAVSYDASASVTKYTIQNIGATTTDYTTQANKFFQGYFTGGVVTGSGSTIYSDGNINSVTNLKVATVSGTSFQSSTNNTSAFQVLNSAGSTVLKVDTTNTQAVLTGGVVTTVTNPTLIVDSSATSTQSGLQLSVAGTARAFFRADFNGNAVLSGTGTGGTYLSWDSGTAGTYFGNGAGSTAAYISPAGLYNGQTITSAANFTGTVAVQGSLSVWGSGGSSAGFQTGWNHSGGNGETDFVNLKQGGVGGFAFWNGANGAYTNQLMYIDSVGNTAISGYATANRFYAGYDSGVANSFNTTDWYRSSGNNGWYNATYGVGWYATQAGRVDTYNNADIYTAGTVWGGTSIIAGRGIAFGGGYQSAIQGNGGNAAVVFNNSNNTAGETIVGFAAAGAVQGTVTINGGTTSYNAFTGSHYVNLLPGQSVPDFGKLMSIGPNSTTRLNGDGEYIYQVAQSSIPNDPSAFGSFNGYTDAGNKDKYATGMYLVSAAGNGDVWVADNGSGNVAVGDPLMSSSLVGYAMKDPKTYAVSHIFAKAAENIDWGAVTTIVNGVKVAKISILYSFYDQPNIVGSVQAQNITVTGQAIFGDSVSISGSLNVSGPTTMTDLTVTGNETIGGTLTVTGLTNVGDITVNGHIITAGNVPTVAVAAAAGSNNSLVTIDGNDTSGTITITTGDATNTTAGIIGPSLGDLVKLNFAKVYGKAPRIIVNGNDAASAGLIVFPHNTATDSFDLSVGATPAPNTTYSFTYFIVQ